MASPEARSAEQAKLGLFIAMAAANTRSSASRGTADRESSRGKEGGKSRCLACLVRRKPRLGLGLLGFGERLVDALLGIGLRQASLRRHQRGKIGALARRQAALAETVGK